jgi:bifunctional DNase/RNase
MAHRRTLLLLLVGVSLAPFGCGEDDPPGVDVPVRIGLVALDSHNIPVLVLEEEGGDRVLPIWIGMDAAHSITAEMERKRPQRPNTHDLAKRLIQGLDAEIRRVVVTKLEDGTYYATVHLENSGHHVEIDARPSDAIAIALRVKAPIFVRSTVFEAAGDVSVPDVYGRRVDTPADPDTPPSQAPTAAHQRSL